MNGLLGLLLGDLKGLSEGSIPPFPTKNQGETNVKGALAMRKGCWAPFVVIFSNKETLKELRSVAIWPLYYRSTADVDFGCRVEGTKVLGPIVAP